MMGPLVYPRNTSPASLAPPAFKRMVEPPWRLDRGRTRSDVHRPTAPGSAHRQIPAAPLRFGRFAERSRPWPTRRQCDLRFLRAQPSASTDQLTLARGSCIGELTLLGTDREIPAR